MKSKAPFKVGDLVTTPFVSSERNIVRRITEIARTDTCGSGWWASAHDGEQCPRCGRPATEIPGCDSTWYKKVDIPAAVSRREYEEDLRRRQREHLDQVLQQRDDAFIPCLHDACPECVGTGVKKDGSPCIHMISCPCPKCAPQC